MHARSQKASTTAPLTSLVYQVVWGMASQAAARRVLGQGGGSNTLRSFLRQGNGGKRRPVNRFRLLEGTGVRQVVLTNPEGHNQLDRQAAEALNWQLMAWENNYMVKVIT